MCFTHVVWPLEGHVREPLVLCHLCAQFCSSFLRAILVTHFVWPFCPTMFTPFVRAKFQRSSPAVAYARRGEKNPFATPRHADLPPSSTLQRIWTPLDTCGHPLSKSYSRVSYIILSSYLYFWTLWILLCRYFVRRRRKTFL